MSDDTQSKAKQMTVVKDKQVKYNYGYVQSFLTKLILTIQNHLDMIHHVTKDDPQKVDIYHNKPTNLSRIYIG